MRLRPHEVRQMIQAALTPVRAEIEEAGARIMALDERVAELEGRLGPELSGGGGDPAGADDLDPTLITFLHAPEVAGWPITSEVTAASARDGLQVLEHTMAGRWPVPPQDGGEGNIWIVATIDGRWLAATFEWLRPGQTEKFVAAAELGAHTKLPEFAGWEPQPGEVVGLFVSTFARTELRTSNERSNIAAVTWGA